MSNMAKMADEVTEIVASQMHYHDMMDLKQSERQTAMQVRNTANGWIERYRGDRVFNARVQSMVAGIMQGMRWSIEREVSYQVNEHIKRMEG